MSSAASLGGLPNLKEMLTLLGAMPKEQLEGLAKETYEATAHMRWVPNPGPQSMAFNCTADQVLYGGQAGGGKTDILIGKATQKHQRSLILRRLNKEVLYLAQRTEEIVGHREGYNGQDKVWKMPDGRYLQFGGCQHPGDEKGYKGQPKDFIGIDEASEFHESQIDYIIQWLRTADQNQRCQLMLATNPPDSAVGEWLINWFGPWVNPEHELYGQVKDGELLYFERRGKEFYWSKEPFEITLHNGRTMRAMSRTFIRSTLDDNPDYAEGDYAVRLANAPEELRKRYERGEFVSEPVDGDWQVIPTLWVMEAQTRWKEMDARFPGPPSGVDMTSIGVDVAQGGHDRTVLAPRYGEWFAPIITKPGKETPNGPAVAGLVMMHMRHAAQINIDLGGGWGGSAYDFLKGNDACSILGFVPSETAMGKTVDGRLKFKNKRAESWWRLREALDPAGPFRLALPPDPELKTELTSVHWQLMPGGVIQLESKDDIKAELRRSPDKGDAVVLAWYSGNNRQRARGAGGLRYVARPHNLQTRTNTGHRPARYDRYANKSKPSGGGSENG
jgi:hypothetical protein